jgi:hypothetical protein
LSCLPHYSHFLCCFITLYLSFCVLRSSVSYNDCGSLPSYPLSHLYVQECVCWWYSDSRWGSINSCAYSLCALHIIYCQSMELQWLVQWYSWHVVSGLERHLGLHCALMFLLFCIVCADGWVPLPVYVMHLGREEEVLFDLKNLPYYGDFLQSTFLFTRVCAPQNLNSSREQTSFCLLLHNHLKIQPLASTAWETRRYVVVLKSRSWISSMKI